MTIATDPADPRPLLLDLRAVAGLLNCSPRHVTRLRDAGKLPAAVRLGRRCLWAKAAIEGWVSSGCPPTAPPAAEPN